MPAILDQPAIDLFTEKEFERAWQRDADAPTRVRIPPDTEILIRRNSPHDFQDRQIYVWIDDEALGEDSLRRCDQPADRTRAPHGPRVQHAGVTHHHRRRRAGRTGSSAVRHGHADGRLAHDDLSARQLSERLAHT